jgi:putative membrane protein
MWNYGMHGAGWGWGMGLLMVIVTIAFWVAIAWFVRWLLQDRPRRDREGPGTGSDALRILDERLARGEITTEEYERLRAALTDKSR